MSRSHYKVARGIPFLWFLLVSSLAWAPPRILPVPIGPPPVKLPPVRLPLEVLGAAGTTYDATVYYHPGTAVRQITGLWMQVHGLSYPNKASIQINNGPWINLNNSTVRITEPEKSYGGIGGAYATIRLTLPLAPGAIVDGRNILRFRFNGTDGLSMGYRVLAFNFLNQFGQKMLPASTFIQDDPNTWQPPYRNPDLIAQGRNLWTTATLIESPLSPNKHIQAKCADCHARDGRDLKYFNYSNKAIIERSVFHGLTKQQGLLIASYVRSLPTPHPGRPWNPPYQPGPGLDSRPASEWAAGAGLDWVLDKDSDMLAYLFPHGISKSAVATTKTLNVRELPIALQLLDWNRWLPRIHPKDAWGSEFVNSNLLTMYDGSGGGSAKWNLRANLSDPNRGDYISSGLKDDLDSWDVERRQFIATKNNIDPSAWTPEWAEKIYSTGLWQMVKEWELLQEFALEDYGQDIFGPTGETRTWPNGIPFVISPFMMGIRVESGAGPLSLFTLTSDYLSNAWYQIQAIVNSGNRQPAASYPVDWGYLYSFVMNLNQSSTAPGALRLTSLMVKAMQNADNGIGPDDYLNGWNFKDAADISKLTLGGRWAGLWQGIDTKTQRAIVTAVVQTWFDKARQYTPAQYYASEIVDPNELPGNNPEGGPWIDRMWYMIPNMRALGVDGTLLNSICDWAQTIWPHANWASLKQ